jgi:predicted nucleic acid-binding protein
VTVIDASVWVSSFISDDVHHAASLQWIMQQSAQGVDFVIPALALPEVAGAIARRLGSSQPATRAVSRMLALPALQVATLDASLGQRAADIAATRRLRGADAVYVATALATRDDLVTWDTEVIRRTKGLLQVLEPKV